MDSTDRSTRNPVFPITRHEDRQQLREKEPARSCRYADLDQYRAPILAIVGKPAEPEQDRTPAVSIRRSVTPKYVVCLECGWRAQMLRRHIQDMHGLNPDEYRVK